jgi:hypothetical protein
VSLSTPTPAAPVAVLIFLFIINFFCISYGGGVWLGCGFFFAWMVFYVVYFILLDGEAFVPERECACVTEKEEEGELIYLHPKIGFGMACSYPAFDDMVPTMYLFSL